MAIGTDDLGRITQQTAVIASDGDRLGTIDQIYTSDTTGDPAWVTLKTGLFGTQESFVPLSDASFDGDDIRVGVTKDAVHGAPRVDAGGHLGVEQEDELYRYYGLHNPDRPEADAGLDDRRAGERTETDRDDRGTGDVDDRDATAGDAHGGHALDAGAGAAAGAAAGTAGQAGTDRDDELAARDAEGRDEVADHPEVGSSSETSEEQEAVRPGERTTRLRRYVVTERVVQTVEELPDDDPR